MVYLALKSFLGFPPPILPLNTQTVSKRSGNFILRRNITKHALNIHTMTLISDEFGDRGVFFWFKENITR